MVEANNATGIEKLKETEVSEGMKLMRFIIIWWARGTAWLAITRAHDVFPVPKLTFHSACM